MPDKKLTDSEIKKALECCTDGSGTGLIKATLDLINRLQAENENLKDILYDAEGVNLVNYWYQQCKIAENGCRNFEEENQSQKAEIERLINHNDLLMSDIEKVKEKLFGLSGNWDGTFGGIDRIVNELKTEAYKEYIAKVKNYVKTKCNPYGKPTFDYDTSIKILQYLDNLLNELGDRTDDSTTDN